MMGLVCYLGHRLPAERTQIHTKKGDTISDTGTAQPIERTVAVRPRKATKRLSGQLCVSQGFAVGGRQGSGLRPARHYGNSICCSITADGSVLGDLVKSAGKVELLKQCVSCNVYCDHGRGKSCVENFTKFDGWMSEAKSNTLLRFICNKTSQIQ